MRRRVERVSAWTLAVASVLLAALYFLNMPFYSGSSVGSHFAWRLEHGRMRVECKPAIHPESFYIDINSEGLKFAPDWHVYAWNDWFFNVPLWVPFGACVTGSAGLFFVTRRRRKPGVCGKCGYDLKGLAAGAAGARCPECGRQEGDGQ